MGLIFGQELVKQLPKNLLLYGLIGYTDSNFARNLEDQKSVMGYYFFLNRVVVSWSSKKQRTVSTLITKAEYIALNYVARKAIWIRKFINKIKLEVVKDFTLYSDNKMSIILTKNAKS